MKLNEGTKIARRFAHFVAGNATNYVCCANTMRIEYSVLVHNMYIYWLQGNINQVRHIISVLKKNQTFRMDASRVREVTQRICTKNIRARQFMHK